MPGNISDLESRTVSAVLTSATDLTKMAVMLCFNKTTEGGGRPE